MKLLRPAGLALILLGSSFAEAAPVQPASKTPAKTSIEADAALNAETFSIQSQVEELVSRRIGQALSTRMEKDAYTVTTTVALHRAEAPLIDDDEQDFAVPSDLQLGLIETQSTEGSDLLVKGGGAGYEVEKVHVLVGLKPELSKELVDSTQAWLKSRVATEFGKNAEVEVSSIQRLPARAPDVTEKPGNSLLNLIKELQGLVGQVLMAATLILAVFLWRLLNGGAQASKSGDGAGNRASPPAPIQAAIAQPEGGAEAKRDSTSGGSPAADWDASLEPGAEKLKRAAQTLVGKNVEGLAPVVSSWIQAGNDGLSKLVCFLDAVSGTELEVQIPKDVSDQLMPIFEKIAAMPGKERNLLLRQAYWDLVSFRSLGTDALVKPFAFLNQLQEKRIRQLVMDENPRLKAVVALNMPDSLRERFIQGLDHEERKRILSESMGLQELEVEEIRSIDQSLRTKTKGEGPKKRSLAAGPLVLRLIDSLGIEEEFSLLQELKQSAPEKVASLRLTHPSVAFVPEWKDSTLSLLLSMAGPDEVLALVASQPEIADRILALAPPTTGDILREELPRLAQLPQEQKASGLRQLSLRLKKSVASGEIKLEDCFEDAKNQTAAAA